MNRRGLVLSASAAGLMACSSGPRSPASPPAETPPPGSSGTREFPHRDEIIAAVDSACSRIGVPGLGLAIYHSDASFAGGFGVTDVETQEGVTPDTGFYIASSTKSLTAMALAILHQRGDVDLDAPLSSAAPAGTFPDAIRPNDVRVRDLLTHTSGLDNLSNCHSLGIHRPTRSPNALAPARRVHAESGCAVGTLPIHKSGLQCLQSLPCKSANCCCWRTWKGWIIRKSARFSLSAEVA